jgi:hypothetical protein
MNDQVLRAWNNGLYEVKTISLSEPNWTESIDGILVLSHYGASGRLYISDINTANGWWYVNLTEL